MLVLHSKTQLKTYEIILCLAVNRKELKNTGEMHINICIYIYIYIYIYMLEKVVQVKKRLTKERARFLVLFQLSC